MRIYDTTGMSKGVLFVTEEEEEDYDDCEDHNDDGVHNVQGDQRDFLLELSAERPEIQVDQRQIFFFTITDYKFVHRG